MISIVTSRRANIVIFIVFAIVSMCIGFTAGIIYQGETR